MTLIGNTRHAAADITLGALLEKLREAAAMPLVFEYDGNEVRPGYHVTEVKAGQFSALDCGANAEAWSEIFVQLWDVDDGDRTHMTAGKFSAIVRKVCEHVALDGSAKLTFEVSDGIKPMQLYCADEPVERGDAIFIHLSPRPSSCKPRDRWLANEGKLSQSSCCGPSTASSCCS
ncbi:MULTISPECIES: DUF6428 family protein [unclassified Ensifer]|uniref:DUF6428 family protein n=1 Tax=unclassified Ensifer TaxID=2633371 RepID=UPI0008138DB8|nr:MULTISPECIES: DUF6428 family protein [unclassified Ensifer]OCO98891.1 hypothetical protein BC362_26995 [Ensifer sp. LC14]OCP04424.1 hypothetical protein BBX50_25620 [Ensifer sp. LC11]OCP04705.1 hypothetical protein BC374_25640 [Ensifer sp. LC13]OCP30529.1 hypothetical protein BC364_25655 [Ensifer sp. LC499]